MQRNLKVVITGGPGSGKSSLIAALKKKGHLCYEEFSRQLIDDGKKRGMENFFLENPLAFSKGLIEERIAQYFRADSLPLNHPHPWVFFDRGLPDVIAYLNVLGEKSDSLDLNIKNYPYDRVVFLPLGRPFTVRTNREWKTLNRHEYFLRPFGIPIQKRLSPFLN